MEVIESARSFVHKTVRTFNKKLTGTNYSPFRVTKSAQSLLKPRTLTTNTSTRRGTQTNTHPLMLLILFSGSNLRAIEPDQ